ncbi:MAG: hypothetical protein MMC23_005255 [Stictis urceolatum]|nr:hypothetical protein [Stictis urceolata]
MVFKRPVPFAGDDLAENVVRIGGSRNARRKRRNRSNGRGGWVNRDSNGVVDVWKIPSSSDVENIEDDGD